MSEPFVDPSARVASSRIFADADVHAQEQERIFQRSWLLLAHESEIPNRKDYVLRS